MAVKGVFASDSGIVGNRKGDFASGLLQTQPTGTAALLALTAGMESVDVSNTVITWFEENHNTGRVSATNAAGTGTSVIVDDASSIVAGTIYMVEASGEFMLVTAVASSTLTVERGFANTTTTTFDGSSTPVPIQRIGTTHEEGSAKPTAVANIGAPRFNYMQIFRNAWDVTGTARKVEYYTGDLVAKNRKDGATFHAEDIERSLIFGRLSIGVRNAQPYRTMDGLLAQITTNVTTQSTKTSYDEVDAFLMDVFAKNIKGKPNERIAYCGNTVIKVLNQIAQHHGVIDIVPGQTEFGLKVNKWLTPYGDISLMTHPLMNESPLWTKDLYVLHPGAIRVRYLRRTMEDSYDKDGTRAGADADYGVYTTELSCEYRAEATGGKYTGIDTAGTFTLTT